MAKTVSFFEQPSPLDVRERRQSARQAILGALLRESMEPPQARPVGRTVVAPHPLEYLGKAFQAYAADRSLRDSFDAQEALAEKKRRAGVEAVRSYFARREGQGALPPGVPPGGAGAPDVPFQAPDPRGAAMEGLASESPLVQQLALGELTREPPDPTQWLKLGDQFSGPSKVKAYLAARQGHSNPGALLEPSEKFITSGQSIFSTREGAEPQERAYTGPRYTEPETIPGPRGPIRVQREQRSGEERKIEGAPSTEVNVGMGPFTKKVGEALAGTAAKRLDELGKQLAGAQQGLDVIRRMEALEKEGVFSNMTSPGVTSLTNIAQSLGISVDEEKLGRTETFLGESARLWIAAMETVTGGARGLTEAETKELHKAIPQIVTSPQARRRAYELYRLSAIRARDRFRAGSKAIGNAIAGDDPAALTDALGGLYGVDEEVEALPPTRPEAPRVEPPRSPRTPMERYEIREIR